ncbi:MAG: hypothetical protein Q9M27_06930 [Mariprofundaceae bacterium]|nr:hypothetical protein [Mariprofundaceae bacterium]
MALRELSPYREQIIALAVDGLMDAAYVAHLANTAAIKQYEKYTDDDSDAA